MTIRTQHLIIGKMKKVAYIILLGILTMTPLFAQTEDTLDRKAKEESISSDAVVAPRDETQKTNLGGIIETLFRGAAEVYQSAKEADREPSEKSYRSSPTTSEPSRRTISTSSTGKSSSAPALAPSAASEAKATSSKSRDVFIDENKNGIDDRLEKSSGGTSKRRIE